MKLDCPIIKFFTPSIITYRKVWGKKEKIEWWVSLFFSGTDHGADIERERLGICFDCFYDVHGNCFKEGQTTDNDKICHCYKKECRF